jgi:hypothetical protein
MQAHQNDLRKTFIRGLPVEYFRRIKEKKFKPATLDEMVQLVESWADAKKEV